MKRNTLPYCREVTGAFTATTKGRTKCRRLLGGPDRGVLFGGANNDSVIYSTVREHSRFQNYREADASRSR